MEAKTPANGREVPGEYFAVGIRIEDPARQNTIKLTPLGPKPPPSAPPEPESKRSSSKHWHIRKATDLSVRRKEEAQADNLADLTDEELISRFAKPDEPDKPEPPLPPRRAVKRSKIPPKCASINNIYISTSACYQ